MIHLTLSLALALLILVVIDRKQTLAFLPRGIPEGNPVAARVMEHFRTDEEGYIPGAKIWFNAAFATLAALVLGAFVLPEYSLIPTGLMAVWLPIQAWCVRHNSKIKKA